MPSDEWTGTIRGGRGEPPTQDKLYKASATSGSTHGPVECLGLTFESEDERREHFLGRLRKGLEELHTRLDGVPWDGAEHAAARLSAIRHWPMGSQAQLRTLVERMRSADRTKDLFQRWKDEVGFPQGEIEDILNLSDPPWHTACPNPFLDEFVATYGQPYHPDELYRRTPFAVDVKEGKTHAVYRAHGYHTKVPHLAIIPSLLHYTEPGDLVLDGFSGSGMTGVAAQWCESAPKSYRRELEAIWTKQGLGKPKWGPRRAILNDLSPLAGFISANYTLPFDVDEFAEAGRKLLDEVDAELGWMYETLHTDGKTHGRIDYTVWSEVFGCSNCGGDIVFTNEALDQKTGRTRDTFPCPHCRSELTKRRLERQFATHIDVSTNTTVQAPRRRPVILTYSLAGEKYQKDPDATDLATLERVAHLPLPTQHPSALIPPMHMTHQRARMESFGITHIHHFFLPRAAHALATAWRRAASHVDLRLRHMLLYFVEQAIWTMSLLNRFRPTGYSQVNQYLPGVYYSPSQHAECSPWYVLEGKLRRLKRTFHESACRTNKANDRGAIVATGTTAHLGLPAGSVDYIFTDPPFGENLYYADLNFLVESWHGVLTNAMPEAIVDRFKRKSLPTYQRLMQSCFEEYRRVLKPGHWMTVVFHNSRNAVWIAIQEAMLAAGFVVADVRTMDKQQGSYRQVTSTAVKQDLIISAYKPNDGLEGRFQLTSGSEEGVWDFLRTHLNQLPVFVAKNGNTEIVHERQPHVLFDRMVAFHVLRRVTVPLSVGEFLAGVSQRYPQRDGMVFLPDQAAEYDRKRSATGDVSQMEIFVRDEDSAIQWLREQLRRKPQSFQDIHPRFLRELRGQLKHEKLPELSEMLDQNFLHYDGSGDVPSQIHSYLWTNYKDLRNLAKDHPALQARARGRWYVPDPSKALDVEKRRTRALLREFEEYRISSQRHLKLFRLEAMRAGFFRAYQVRDYETIIRVAEKLPPTVLREDQKLLLWYDQAVTRTATP